MCCTFRAGGKKLLAHIDFMYLRLCMSVCVCVRVCLYLHLSTHVCCISANGKKL